MTSIEEFITQFHSFSINIPDKHKHGNPLTDLPEKRRRFNSFVTLLNTTLKTSNELSNLVLSITPKNSIQENFRIDIMIKFNLYDIIINELKFNSNNNKLLIRKLLKNYKIFERLFRNVDTQLFVDDILPNLSYSLKLRLINGISKFIKNDNLADEYFVKVEKKYGFKLAMNLLPGCTITLIKTKMDRYFVKLSIKQLINICKKDQEFLMYYLNHPRIKRDYKRFNYFYITAIKEFAKVHPEMFWKLKNEYNIASIKFGKSATKTMFRHRSKTSEEGHKFLNNFSDRRQVCKVAIKDGQLQEFFCSLFPMKLDTINYNIFIWSPILNFIQHLPVLDQFALVNTVFQEKYGINLLNSPEYWEECLQAIPIGQRQSLLDTLGTIDENLIYFYEPKKSIPYIKEKLQNCKDGKERGKLILLMCKSCMVNNDIDALSETLDYVLTRHRNDLPALSVFFNKFMCFFCSTKLDDRCWKKIVDISKIFEISRPDYNKDTFYKKYLTYLIRNKRPITACSKKRLENILTTYDYISAYAFSLDLSICEKIFLEEIGQYIHLYKTHKNYRVICLSFLEQVYNFNIQNKRNPINLKNYSALLDQLEMATNYASNDIIKYGLKYYPTDEIWHDLFWKRSTLNRDNVILSWYMQKWPQKVADKLDKILNDLNNKSIDKFFIEARKYLDENAIETIKTYAKNLLYTNDYKKVKLAITIYYIIAPEILLDISSIIEKLESNIKIPVTELLVTKLVIKRLHKIRNPYDTFQLVLQCSNRNFAKCAIIPLCSAAYNIPEIIMLDELPKFTNTALCVKKTILSLSKLIFSSTDFAKIIKIFNEKEANASMKRIMLQRAFECLNENPSEFFWNFTKNCILTMDESDADVYDPLMKLTNVPQQYLSAYIPLIFEQLSNNPHLEIQKNKYKLLESIPTQIIKDLNIEFLKKIIKETATLKNVCNLHWNCILSVEEKQQEELFEENFEVLQNFIDVCRHELNKNHDINAVITCYVTRFLDTIQNSKYTYMLIEKFIVLWNSKMKIYSSHPIFMIVLFTEIYVKSDCDPYKTGIEIKALLQQYIENIGNSIISLLSDQLGNFLIKTEMKKQDELVRFLRGFLENNNNQDMYLLVLDILSKNPPKPHNLDNYKDILQIIQKSSVPAVKLRIEIYLEEFQKGSDDDDDDDVFGLFC